MKKLRHSLQTRLTAMLLAIVCAFGLLPVEAFAASKSTIKLEKFRYYGANYQPPKLGNCLIHQMVYDYGGKTTIGFCGTKGATINGTLRGQTWGNPKEVTNPTVRKWYCPPKMAK